MGTEVWSMSTYVSEVPFVLASETSGWVQNEAKRHSDVPSRKDLPQQYVWLADLGLTSARVSAVSLLEWAAEAGDESAFLELAASLDWDDGFSATDAAYVVRLALRAGAHLYARDFSSRAAKRYPYAAELRRMAAVLAPPRVIRRMPAQDEALEMNRRWLEDHGAEYRALWVALRRGQLLASAVSLQELRQALPGQAMPSSDMLITRVD